MDEQNQNAAPTPAAQPVSGVSRPWQATFLGVIDVLGAVGAFLMSLVFVFFQGFITEFFNSEEGEMVDAISGIAMEASGLAAKGISGLLAGFTTAFGVFFIFIGILGIFMAKAVFKGHKWSPIITIAFGALGVLGMVSSFESSVIAPVVVNLFVIYLAVSCVKHPYFGSK